MVVPAPLAVRELLDPVLRAAGYVLEDVRLTRAGARHVLQVVVDLDEGTPGDLDLDRVADATRLVSDALDAHADALPDRYDLEVSSPGATRPLTERRHWVRAVGRTVRVERTDGSVLLGVLRAVDLPDHLVVVPEEDRGKGRPPRVGPPVAVPLDEVRRGRVEVDLRGLGPVAPDDEVPDTHDEHDDVHDDEHDDGHHDGHHDEHDDGGTAARGED